MFTSRQVFFMASDIQLLQSRHHGTEIRPQVLRRFTVPGGLTSAGFHGFQRIQTVTLSSRHKLHLFLVLELVLPVCTPLRKIACRKRIKLELSAQAVWQFPSFSREEVQLIVHVSRSLSDQIFCGSFPGHPEFPTHHRYLSCGCLLPAGA